MREMNKPLRLIKTEPVHRAKVYTERERDSGAKKPRKPKVCTHCGTGGQLATVCLFKHEQCNHFKHNGYIARVCWKKNPSLKPTTARRSMKKVHHLEEQAFVP